VVQLEAPPGFWTEAAEDPFYKNVIVPDEAAFFERSNFVVISGNNNCVVEGGKPTENVSHIVIREVGSDQVRPKKSPSWLRLGSKSANLELESLLTLGPISFR